MADSLSATQFLDGTAPLLDVRSPGEFERGHIPGAISFPLFDDVERAQVGICYKHQGRDAAVELGLELVAPKMVGFVRRAKQLADRRWVRLYCWRGGMRSSSMAWLLETAGLKVALLRGGYKAFRRWVIEVLAQPKPIVTLGGLTGTGKTALLAALANRGEQVLDLENLANHRGSSYGSLGLPPQPSDEHFSNLVAMNWAALSESRPVWIEAESRRIGTCRVPDELFTQMMAAPVIEVKRSRSERIQLLLEDYGQADPDALIMATERIRKRLGGLRTQQAIAHIQTGDLAAAIAIVLDYYDKTYRYDLEKRGVSIDPIDLTGVSPDRGAQQLIAHVQTLALQSRVPVFSTTSVRGQLKP